LNIEKMLASFLQVCV